MLGELAEDATDGVADAVATGADAEGWVVGVWAVDVGAPVAGGLTTAVGPVADAVAAGEVGPMALGDELHPASASAQTAPVAITNRARTTRSPRPAIDPGVTRRRQSDRPGPAPRPEPRSCRAQLARDQLVRSAVSSTTKSVGRELFSVPEIEIVTVWPANDPTLNERSW